MDMVITARVRAKFPLDEALAEVWAGKLGCGWCGRRCPVIVGMRVAIGRYETFFNLAELGELQLFRDLCAFLGPAAKAYTLGWRYCRSRQARILSSGCPACGECLGDAQDLGPWTCREKVGAFPLKLDGMWRGAMLEPGDERERAKAAYPKNLST